MKAEVRWQDLDETSQFQQAGFQIVKSLIKVGECDQLSIELTPLFKLQQQSTKSKIGGVRNLLRANSSVCRFTKSPDTLSLVEKFTGSPAFPVRAIFFDKNQESNWVVPWHQDLSIAVKDRIETPDFSGWSIKDGVLHVQPPQEILESMVTVRLHLDDCASSNGALRVVSGSHLFGKLNATEILHKSTSDKIIVCELSKGDALLMRPLLLHASSPAQTPKHRRVLHIEYATQNLPNGLEWLPC